MILYSALTCRYTCSKLFWKQEGQHIGATYKSILKVLLKQYRSPTDPNKFKSATIISVDHFQITMRHDLDRWPFDPKINRAHPWLMGSKCMKFQDHRLITESVIVRKPFSNNHAPWPWPLDLKINRAHPWLMVSKCTKFHDHRLITESVIVRKPFSNNHAPWPWPLTSKSIGRILDSWWVSVWSFMIIGWLQSQLSSGNHFQITMCHDLDLWPFDPKINRAHPWLMGSKCMKFHDHRWITESVIVRKLVWRTDRLTDRQTDGRTDRVQTYSPLRFHRWGTNKGNTFFTGFHYKYQAWGRYHQSFGLYHDRKQWKGIPFLHNIYNSHT